MSNLNRFRAAKALRTIAFNQMAEIKAEIVNFADPDGKIRFQIMYEFFDRIKDDFQRNHLNVISLGANLEDVDLAQEEAIRTQFEFNATIVAGNYKMYFKDDATFSPLANSSTNMNLNPPNHIRLPRVEIPKFTGDIKNFRAFIELFTELIDHNTSLTEIEKFSYLLSLLEGPPLEFIQIFPMVAANYVSAFQALNERYDNKKLIAFAQLESMERAPYLNDNNKNAKTLHLLIDTFTKSITSLSNMGFSTDSWDIILLYSLSKHLDEELLSKFESENNVATNLIPRYDQLRVFLIKQTAALDTVEYSRHQKPKPNIVNSSRTTKKPQTCTLLGSTMDNPNTNNQVPQLNCLCCKGSHSIYKCLNFRALSIKDRNNFVKTNKLCQNCLSNMHTTVNCRSNGVCFQCHQRHHSLLHFINQSSNSSAHQSNNSVRNQNYSPRPSQVPASSSATTHDSPNNNTFNSSNNNSSNTQFCGLLQSNDSTVLLATATIQICNGFGQFVNARALLDCGSQTSYISQTCFNQLGLKQFNSSVTIHGLSDMNTVSSLGMTNFVIKSCLNDIQLPLDAIILKKLCPNMPTVSLSDKNTLSYISRITLADEHFNTPHEIDLVLGADIYPNILLNGNIPGNVNEPYAINTIFGWVLMGKVNSQTTANSVTSLLSFANSDNSLLNATLSRFWEIEELPTTNLLSPQEELCETIFQNSHIRTSSGRYQVDLPFKDTDPIFNVTDARNMALKRFLQLENRFSKQDHIKQIYQETITDYLTQEILEEIPLNQISRNCYYIPHHCIEKLNKTRIVYDASARVINAGSLNDQLLIGKRLQTDISRILTNFRLHKIVFTCDIKLMFPQILVNAKHRDYLRILYRSEKDQPIKDYRMSRVTFGLSCSPFLANRVILQLAQDERDNFPLGAKILEENLYVDDCCCGADSESEVLNLRNELISILQTAKFELRKWSSNKSSIINDLPPDHVQLNPLNFNEDSDTLKILGLCWCPREDVFIYKINQIERPCSKRNILSDIARIYDPLGFLAPTIVFIKQILQSLWIARLDWDEHPPTEICENWLRLRSELSLLETLKIPRPIFKHNNPIIQLHGFADASAKAYAAVVYLRIMNDSDIKTYLIMSKSKIAPLKPLSIPRLELTAAVLLAELITHVKDLLIKTLTISQIFAWSDSAVALCWIHSLPHRFPSFIANRISKVQERVSISSWRHLKSAENPADCASRGLLPSKLISHELWWTGPTWLVKAENSWPISKIKFEAIEPSVLEEKKITLMTVPIEENCILLLLNKFSSFAKIQRIVAYILRFINNSVKKNLKLSNILKSSEYENALLRMITVTQQSYFTDEIIKIRAKQLPSKYLRKLNVFLDEKNLMRVGGRLGRSNLTYETKYPIILPRTCRFTELLIEHFHIKYLHPGFQQLHFLLLRRFWILSPKRAIKSIISRCKNCWKLDPKVYQPIMADLPPLRVSNMKPFCSIAIDFCGYFFIKPLKGRNIKSHKSYVAVFICLATKAIHLELVSDLSSEAFLAAFRRFIARRGRCSIVVSDCGTNFVGASKFLLNHLRIAEEAENFEWKFNPPSAPHFSGLVEAGVKSFKTHFRRVIGDQILTHEEFFTMMVQIEAILNSRPLSSISSDPNDLNSLTPGHFLTMEPLVTLPDPDVQDIQLNRLDRWQLTQRLHQNFWSRWSSEYLHTLQQRAKWFTDGNSSPTVGDLVVIKTDNCPPLRWPMGRITQLYPGSDNIIRVASVQTKQGIIKRPLVKLCPLPHN